MSEDHKEIGEQLAKLREERRAIVKREEERKAEALEGLCSAVSAAKERHNKLRSARWKAQSHYDGLKRKAVHDVSSKISKLENQQTANEESVFEDHERQWVETLTRPPDADLVRQKIQELADAKGRDVTIHITSSPDWFIARTRALSNQADMVRPYNSRFHEDAAHWWPGMNRLGRGGWQPEELGGWLGNMRNVMRNRGAGPMERGVSSTSAYNVVHMVPRMHANDAWSELGDPIGETSGTWDIWREAVEAGVMLAVMPKHSDDWYVLLRPENIVTDGEGLERRLHCEDGPAVRWRDGDVDYYWRGVLVPEHFITDKDSLTSDDVLNEGNIERRRALLDIVGIERFIQDVDATVIDEDLDSQGNRRRLLRFSFNRTRDSVQAVHVICPSTGREYMLGVPVRDRRHRSINTCQEAVAWTFGKTGRQYNPVVET